MMMYEADVRQLIDNDELSPFAFLPLCRSSTNTNNHRNPQHKIVVFLL